MAVSIRCTLFMILSVLLSFAASPSLAASSPEQIAAKNAIKIQKIVDKAATSLDKSVDSYEKKVNSLVVKTTAKVAKLIAKGKPAEDINETVNKAIMTGMGYAGSTRTKLDSIESSSLRSLSKYSTHADADEADAEITETAENCFTNVDEIWNAAGTALHALEADQN